MFMFMAHSCVYYTLDLVRQLTPMSLDYEGHVNVFMSGRAVFTLFLYCVVDAKSLRCA